MSKGIGGHTRPHNGNSVDWLTPPEIVKALGDFDLDPCTPEVMPWQTAKRRYWHLGLEMPWRGRVWLNPPYGPVVGDWLKKLADHGHGVAIVFARTETEWFHAQVWQRASALLFLRGRLHFHRANGERAKHNAGGPTVLVAYGDGDAEILSKCGIDGAFIRLTPSLRQKEQVRQ